ncbi:MAG: thiamine kinase [Pseudohongiellaceae bacterium]|jgi:thiamine kinase
MGGATNHSYLIASQNQQYVVRLFAENSRELNINRDSEFTIAGVANEHGIAAKPLYLSPTKIYSVSEYLSGELINVCQLPAKKKLQLLAATLCQLHSISVPGWLPSLNIVTKAESYWFTISSLSLASKYLQYKPVLQNYFVELESEYDLVLCHNDLVQENMIVTDQGLQLIDWEYSAMGDPYFDLASVVVDRALNAEDELCFINAYSQKLDLQRLQQAKYQVAYMSCLWWLIQEGESKSYLLKDLLNELGLGRIGS